MITAHIAVAKGRNTFSLQTDLRIGLGSRFYSVENVSVNGADLHIAAECCLGKRNRCSGENVHILSLEDRMTGYLNLDKQISSRSAVYTRLTFFTDPDALSIVDSGRNVDLNAFSAGCIARAVACGTFIANDLSGSVTIRTRCHVSHRTEHGLLCVRNLTGTVTFGACFR